MANFGPVLTEPDDVLAGVFLSKPVGFWRLWWADGRYWISDDAYYLRCRVPVEPSIVTYESLLSEFEYLKLGRNINVLDVKTNVDYSVVISSDLMEYSTLAAAAAVLGFPVSLHVVMLYSTFDSTTKTIVPHNDTINSDKFFTKGVVIIDIGAWSLKCYLSNGDLVVCAISANDMMWPIFNTDSIVATIPLCDESAFDVFRDKLSAMLAVKQKTGRLRKVW